MPFKKVGDDSYTSTSGRHFNGAQVRLYYANGGKFPGQKGGGEMSTGYAKGGDVRVASYAEGGPVLGRTRDFLKEPDQFTSGRLPPKNKDAVAQDEAKTGKCGKLAKPTGDKCLKTVKPRG